MKHTLAKTILISTLSAAGLAAFALWNRRSVLESNRLSACPESPPSSGEEVGPQPLDSTLVYGIRVPFVPGTRMLPVKSELPDELKDALKTQHQWESSGYVPRANAQGIFLIPGRRMRRPAKYYHESEVIPQIYADLAR